MAVRNLPIIFPNLIRRSAIAETDDQRPQTAWEDFVKI